MYKKEIPLLITFLGGLVFVIQSFVPSAPSQRLFSETLQWLNIRAAAIIFLGALSLWLTQWRRIRRRDEGWGFNIVTLVSLVAVALIGIIGGREPGSLLHTIFTYVQAPIQSTLFALLAFYIASAAFRAFRAKNMLSTVLFAAAIIMMLGRVPIGEAISPHIPELSNWILRVPSLGASRAIQLGISLGTLSITLKILLGIERGYAGL